MRTLEPAAVQPDSSSVPTWDLQRGMLFVAGALMVAAAALTTWRILPQRQALNTRQPAFREIEFDVQLLTPIQAWDAWEHLREQKLEFRATPEYLASRAQYREFSLYLYVAWAAAALGVLLMAGALVGPRLISPRPRRRASAGYPLDNPGGGSC
jgi:hypothetical protein